MMSGQDPGEDDEHEDEPPWDDLWQFVQWIADVVRDMEGEE